MNRGIKEYFRIHWQGWVVANLGLALNVIFLLGKYFKYGSGLWEHIAEDAFDNILIFSTLPLFIFVGFLLDRKIVLEREVKRYSKSLEEQLERRADFVNMAAHELRTPLTPIIGYLDLLKGEVEGEKALGYIEIMQRNALRAKRLIDQMLDLSMLDAGRVELKYSSINVKGLVDEIFENHVLSKHHFSSDVPDDLIVYADRDRIFFVLDELISNAIRYSPENTEIKVKVEELKESYLFSVIDQGIGIAKEDRKRIFERFYIVDGDKLEREVKRTGLGLALVKGYIELHGGETWVESELGKGSTFYFTIPKLDKIV